MTVLTLTIDQLEVSELNVRLNEEDANATSALETSIAEAGLWLPLIIHPITVLPSLRAGGAAAPISQRWGVLDGGRRCRAIRRLVDAGRLPADWPIDCVERDVDTSKITELSLGAWLLARDLRPYEVAAAVAKMLHQGMAPEDIARNLGQDPQWVAQQLRLGDLAPEIFASVAAGDISIDQARAFAATADHDLQRAAFTHFAARHARDRHPEQIRAWLKVGDRELARLLAFVGEESYRAAGGAYELDLFADQAEQRGRVADEGKLRQLVETKLDKVRRDLRHRSGRPNLRFISDRPTLSGYVDNTLELQPEKYGRTILLPEGDVVALLEVGNDAAAHVSWWWASRKAQSAARKEARQLDKSASGKPAPAATPAGSQRPVASDAGFDTRMDYSAAQRARASVREEHGLSADGLQVVRSLRRELLRALLIADATDLKADGTLGRDYVIWAQLRQELRGAERATVAGARGLASAWHGAEDAEPREIVRPHLEQAEAHAVWERALGRIRLEPFIALDDPAAALEGFIHADEEVKALAGAVLAGLALLRSANVPGWRIPAHDRLAALAGGCDAEMLRAYWTPTADFVGLFPKLRRLELIQPYEDPLCIRRLAAGKDGEATRAAADVLAARCWVHPLLTFAMSEGLAIDEVMTVQEPA